MKIFLIILSLAFIGQVNAQIITTVAGNGTGSNSCAVGDGASALAAMVWAPQGIVVDAVGNIFISDYGNGRIRKVDLSNIIHTIAGGCSGYCCGPQNGILDTTAWVGEVPGLGLDKHGNLFIADFYEIQKINTSSIIYIVAGNGTTGFTGDGGAATNAEINLAEGVATDTSGNLYIADSGNNRIRKVNSSGVISTIAGIGTQGYSGNGGQATLAKLNSPKSIAIDALGNLFFTDGGNNCIRKISVSGIITTIVGNGSAGFSGDGGQATSAELNNPYGIAIDTTGNIYVSDSQNNRIRIINTSGIINTYAGNGVGGYSGDGGQATLAKLSSPLGIALDTYNNLYICDGNRVRKINNPSASGIYSIKNDLQFSVYPNPTSDQLFIEANTTDNITVDLYDVNGRHVFSANVRDKSNINVATLDNGIYTITIKTADRVINKKLVIAR